jgi:hypothetical protein
VTIAVLLYIGMDGDVLSVQAACIVIHVTM